MKPIAFVIPWFGKDQKGGAEQQAWQLATRLAARGHKIEVLTTCCRSFHDNWSVNHFRAGKYVENDLIIRRFRVNRRRQNDFDNSNSQLLSYPREALRPGVQLVSNQVAATFVNENINSKTLLEYLQQYKEEYHVFIFFALSLRTYSKWSDKCCRESVFAVLSAQ